MRRTGLANKVLIVIVLLLALAAVLGFILTGTQGNALGAINDSTSNTDGQIDDKKDSLSDSMSDMMGGSSNDADSQDGG